MGSPRIPGGTAAEIARAVESYRETNDFSVLLDELLAISTDADLDELVAAVEPYRTIPEIAGPVYERVVAERPERRARARDAREFVLAERPRCGGDG